MSAHTPEDQTPIQDRDQLIEFMLARVKPSSEWVIGTEHEKIGYSLNTQGRPTFEGEIGELLAAIEREGWRATRERSVDERGVETSSIIALHHQGASVTLEPGGQLELSGAPLRTLKETAREAEDHLAIIKRLSEPLGLIWSGIGSDPTPPHLTPRMPKARYQVMRRYLPTRGKLALHMMHATATIQCNLDYKSEADAMRKLRASLYVQPVVMAMFANSFVLDHQLRSGSCARSAIWLDTDPDRYLYPAEWLADSTPIRNYVDWALNVPMFFIARDGVYLDCAGLPFTQFMREGFQGHQATMGDFELHLSTLFPDARLKQHLEVRGADMSTSEHITALSALHVGLLYDDQSLEQTLALFEHIKPNDLWTARHLLDEAGLNTPLGERTLQNFAEDLLDLASRGLSRWEPGAELYLSPLIESISRGETPADQYRFLWKRGYEHLMEGTKLM